MDPDDNCPTPHFFLSILLENYQSSKLKFITISEGGILFGCNPKIDTASVSAWNIMDWIQPLFLQKVYIRIHGTCMYIKTCGVGTVRRGKG